MTVFEKNLSIFHEIFDFSRQEIGIIIVIDSLNINLRRSQKIYVYSIQVKMEII